MAGLHVSGRSPPIAPVRRGRLKAIVYIAGGIVTRVRGIDPYGTWDEDDRGYADVPVTKPLPRCRSPNSYP
ncbi:MAG: hypothetical protein ACREQ5_34210, partial [Candidatus Dormibacteria bacterium]